MKVAAPPPIYILQRSCHHNPEPINLNPEPINLNPEPINLNPEPQPTINNNLSNKVRYPL